ncbi:MAG: polysaccharide biosynthesis C-terminal domain-containing protein, partial [Candidatus Methanomethylophilaceae archaeon]|nr:polysaccharide biosynthesis C-terminal domain-containing protein [Candidatus Methanomethylophilaceae archaeon]
GIGAATSVVIAYTLFLLVLVKMVKSYTGFRLSPRLWKIAIAFILTLGLLYLEDQYFTIDGLLMLAVSGISAEVVFLGLMILFRELKVKYLLSIWKKLRDDSD